MRLTEVKVYAKPTPPEYAAVETRESVLLLNPVWFVGASTIYAPGSWTDGLTEIDTLKGQYIVREKPEEIFDLVKALIVEIANS